MHERSSDISRQVAVLLDVGGGNGALVLHTGPELAGTEIHVSPSAPDGTRTHAEVHQRSVSSGGTAYAAVFPALRPGSYTLWATDARSLGEALVTEGRVTDVTASLRPA